MEKSSLNNHGGLKLPIGYRFHPTDEELIVHYLKRKVFGIPLPAYVIPQFNVFISDPSNLPGDMKEKRYFFSERKGNGNGGTNLKREVSGHGFWKETGKLKKIVDFDSNQLVGIRRSLVYNEGKKRRRNHHHETKWIIHEFSLVGSVQFPNSNQISNVEFGDWLVYSVFQKQRKPKKGKKNEEPSVVDFTIEESTNNTGPPQPSSPSFNGDSEASFDNHEETRDQNGDVIRARAGCSGRAESILHAEGMALFQAIGFAELLPFNLVEVESDNQTLIKEILKTERSFTSCGVLVDEIKQLSSVSSIQFNFTHVCRDGNKVAHCLAHQRIDLADYDCLNIPSYLIDVVHMDKFIQ